MLIRATWEACAIFGIVGFIMGVMACLHGELIAAFGSGFGIGASMVMGAWAIILEHWKRRKS
jgi:hypothetical protein